LQSEVTTRQLQDDSSGLCVLELGQMVAAPFCGKLLADPART
jgi:crotonobetainyl-CoA:carnitine CoA-transferase CaiB-like acyl-CoA transferase